MASTFVTGFQWLTTVSVTRFKDLAYQILHHHSDIKLLPPTAKPWETSLTKWFDKQYTSYF